MAEAFLSTAIQVVLQRLASGDILNFFRVRKLQDGFLLKKLEMTLNCLDKVIEDAEERQYRDDRVKRWLDELKDTVFKAEDMLDEIATEASRQKLQLQLHPATGNLRNYFTSIVNQFDKEIESSIKELVDYLEFLANKRDELGLKEGSTAGSDVIRVRGKVKRPPTTSLTDESQTYGRDADKERMIEILLSHSVGANQLPLDVIAIVGMGGMGKTTLARLVYEDERMKDQFQHRVWVCISQEFDVVQATKEIHQELECQPKNSDDLAIHQLELVDKLKGKKFFLVLDDVWSENRQIWEDFRTPFKHVALGSKILVTTRNKRVAEVMHSTHAHHLKPLHDEDCWKLFAKHAFNSQHHGKDPKFESIGREIIKKCGGLPLAIKTLGSLLHTKLSLQDWVKILENDIWHLSENDSNIIPSLRLSYHYLPSNLKRCFAYCSIFSKDYMIEKNVLIQLWMAEGLLHSNRTGESVEEVGNEIFNDLVSRSFFEPSNKGGNYFIMHELLHDLAKFVMGEFSLRLEVDWAEEIISMKARYLTLLANDHAKAYSREDILTCHRRLDILSSLSHLLKYLRALSLNFAAEGYILSNLTHFKYLRALSMNGCGSVSKLTDDIDNLKHLRYLDLSNTEIEKLPDSMCSMINLQTLKLKNCYMLVKLPSKFHKLINMRHLDLENSGIKEMPKYMGKLEQLQTMTQFVVGENKGCELKELGALKRIKGTLILSNLENIIDPKNAGEANLKEKHLDEIVLDWVKYFGSREVSREKEEQILEALEVNCEVKQLWVSGYGGMRFPHWFGGSHLCNLVSLYLSRCIFCVNLPPLGQLPSLEKLEIFGLAGIKVIGEEFYGNGSLNVPFRSLSYLRFDGMREWEEWNKYYEGDSFPCLQELYIWDCPKLTKSLPQHLPSLKKLMIVGCYNLKTSLPKASAVEELRIVRCGKISLKKRPTCRLTEGLTRLRDLHLEDCGGMEELPKGIMLSSLQCLFIRNCPKLIVSHKEWGMHELLSLEQLEISEHFEDLECFPEGGLRAPKLHSLSFVGCTKLRRINYRGLLHLHSLSSLFFDNCVTLSLEGMPEEGLPTSLRDLTLRNCPEMESLPKGGLFSNLHRLTIWICPKLIASGMYWGLHELQSLEELELTDFDVEFFPKEGLLPPNLHSLSFISCYKLKRINCGVLLHLHSLASLSFKECPSMSFEGMPEEGLPTSLTHLCIGDKCPLLEERCQRERGPDWPKISHIPHLTIR